MLILTRRVGEALLVGNDVTVVIMSIKGNQVRIGVQAPKDVAIQRDAGCEVSAERAPPADAHRATVDGSTERTQ